MKTIKKYQPGAIVALKTKPSSLSDKIQVVWSKGSVGVVVPPKDSVEQYQTMDRYHIQLLKPHKVLKNKHGEEFVLTDVYAMVDQVVKLDKIELKRDYTVYPERVKFGKSEFYFAELTLKKGTMLTPVSFTGDGLIAMDANHNSIWVSRKDFIIRRTKK